MLCLVVLLVVSLLSLFAGQHYVGELAALLGWYLGWASLATTLLLLTERSMHAAGIALCLAGMHFWPVMPLYLNSPKLPQKGVELEVAVVNLFNGNYRADLFKQWNDDKDPDLIALLEVSPFWQEVIKHFENRYPHQYLVEAKPPAWKCPPWKIGLLSKYPIENPGHVTFHDHAIPYVSASVCVEGCSVDLMVLHLMTPTSTKDFHLRDQALERIAEEIEPSRQVIVLGDFNASLYSPAFRRFMEKTGLKDSREGFGLQPTWMPFPSNSWLCIDLDHILVRPEFVVTYHACGPGIGSDHLPLCARLVFPPSKR